MPPLIKSSSLDPASLKELSDSELSFVRHLISDDLWRPTHAARLAGYKNPPHSAMKLMRRPHILRALGQEQRRRLERLQLKADEVLHVLATGLFFNPLSLFKPSKDGTWLVEDLDSIPDEIGRTITKIKTKTIERTLDDGTVETQTFFEIELMNKTKLLEMAMKHCGVDGTQKIEHSGSVDMNLGIQLNQLLSNVEETRRNQVIDGSIIDDTH